MCIMKSFFLLIGIFLSINSYSQKLNQTAFETSPGQQILLKFDYPIVKVSSWNENKISILMHVLINGKENQEAYTLTRRIIDNETVFTGKLLDTYSIPFMYQVFHHGKVIPELTNSSKGLSGL